MEPQVLINGLLLGAIYAAVGVGFSLTWGVLSIINIAHGAMIMLGAYTTYWTFASFGLDPFLSIPVSAILLFGLGYLLQKTLINRVLEHGVFMTLILTFGISLTIIGVAVEVFSSDYRVINPGYAGSGWSFAGVVVPYQRLAIFVISLALVAGLSVVLDHTRLGRAVRAISQNASAAALVGVNVPRLYAMTFAIGASLAGAAGSLLSMTVTVTPDMGGIYIGKAFVVAALGGLGTIWGVLAGGMILGLAEAFGASLIGGSYQLAIGFAILVLVLLVRPEGVLGRQFYAEAS